MGLERCRVLANIAVKDVARAREFYEGNLGLKPGPVRGDGGTTYSCADGTAVHIYCSPDNAGLSTATQTGWITADIEAAVDELAASGVEFERYETDEIHTNEKGIAEIGGARAAWFRDPDGNVLGLLTS